MDLKEIIAEIDRAGLLERVVDLIAQAVNDEADRRRALRAEEYTRVKEAKAAERDQIRGAQKSGNDEAYEARISEVRAKILEIFLSAPARPRTRTFFQAARAGQWGEIEVALERLLAESRLRETRGPRGGRVFWLVVKPNPAK